MFYQIFNKEFVIMKMDLIFIWRFGILLVKKEWIKIYLKVFIKTVMLSLLFMILLIDNLFKMFKSGWNRSKNRVSKMLLWCLLVIRLILKERDKSIKLKEKDWPINIIFFFKKCQRKRIKILKNFLKPLLRNLME